MSFVFERAEAYKEYTGYLYQTLAENYLLGKKFCSLDEALNQRHEGKTLLEHGFDVEEMRIRPTTLPLIIREVDVFVKVHGEKDFTGVAELMPFLKARSVD